MATTFQNYKRVNYGDGVRYRDAKTGKSLTQDEYERLWMRENNVRPQFVAPKPGRRAPAEMSVGRREGLAGLEGLFTGDDFESRLKRELATMGLSEERGRKIYSDMLGNAALLTAGGGGIAVDALKFGALKFGTEMFTHGDVREAGKEALGEAGAIGALGALGKAGAAVARSPTGRKIAAVLGSVALGAGAVSQIPTQTEEEREAALDWKQIMTDIQSSANPVPAAASAPLETVVRVRQAAKAGDAVHGAIGGGDPIPDEVREFYRDPLTGGENVPGSVKRDWEVYRTMHPDAAGYSWNSVKGFSAAKDIDPGFVQVPKANDIDPGFTRPPKEEPTWYAHKDYVPGTGKNKYGESVVGYPESSRGTRKAPRGEDSAFEGIKRRIGAVGEVADAGIAWLERQAKETADMDVPILSTAAKILQPAYVGTRAAIAKATSGGGKYYQPEVRDERYFSRDALREMAGNLARNGGQYMTRFDYTGIGGGTGAMGNAAAWEASQSVGGASVRNGKIVDKFDVDSKDPYGISDGAHLANKALGVAVDAGHFALGVMFGNENDPDVGKVRTEIPLSKIPGVMESRRMTRQASKAGDANRFTNSRNFLATDKVPDTIFGIPIVSRREDYTEEDIAFFREHPEAGGYYDMGDAKEEAAAGPGVPEAHGAVLGGDFRSRYLSRTRYEQAIVKNLKPMIGANGDNETASQFLNGAIERRSRLFDDDVSRNAPTAGDLLTRAMNYVPPAPTPKPAPAKPGVLDRAKEAIDVAKDLAGLAVGGYADATTVKPEELSILSGAAGVARQVKDLGGSAEGTGTFVNGKIVDATTGKARKITDADRRDMELFKKDIGLQQAAKGGETRAAKLGGGPRGAYPGSLNNPGNVEKRRERRPGEVDSPHERWAKFATPQDGLREMADAIRQIADVKLAGAGKDFTIRNFAEVYAPRRNRKGEKENDTDKYIRDVSSYSGLDADAPLSRDVDSMAKLLRTVVRFESGYPHSRWFTDDEYRDAAGRLRKTSGR